MCTSQKYPIASSGATSIVPTVATVDEFIARNADLIGSYPGDLATNLTARLQLTPVRYTNVLSGISLLRAFVPPAPAHTPCHYALLLRKQFIVGLMWIPVSHDIETESLFAYDGETRDMMKRIFDADATGLLLATTINDDTITDPANCLLEFGQTESGLNLFDVKLLDWLLLYPDQNFSLGCLECEYAHEEDDLTVSQIVNHSIARL